MQVAKRSAIASVVGVTLVVAVAVAAGLNWESQIAAKQLPQATDADLTTTGPTATDAATGTSVEEISDPTLPMRIALSEAQARSLALNDEVARLRWLALAQRRDCVIPPDPPQVAEADPPEDPPVAPDPPAEPDPIVVAVAPPAPPPPSFTPVRERAPDPPPPPPAPPAPPPPPDPPQVAVVAPPPQPPPPSADPEFDSRIRREGGQQSEQLVTLIWNNTNDLDLHVVCPTGERVYFANIAACGSRLDIDMNASTNRLSTAPVENIVWPSGLPRGRYQVYVDHYANHGSRDPTPFRIRVRVRGEERVFNGSIQHGEPPRYITEFFVN